MSGQGRSQIMQGCTDIPNARLVRIDSLYGHDGFMVETEKIGQCLRDWM